MNHQGLQQQWVKKSVAPDYLWIIFILDSLKMQFLHKQSVVTQWAKEPRQASLLRVELFKSAGNKQVEVIEGWAQHVFLYADYHSL